MEFVYQQRRPGRRASSMRLLISRSALCAVALVAVACAAAAPEEPTGGGGEVRPNILWILAEDMGPELGILGTPEVRTPNLDALARSGVLYTRAFTTTPVCSTSRSSFNTGMYASSIGAHNHRSHRRNDPSPYPFPLPEGVRLVSERLRDAGYFTANVVQFPAGVEFRGTGKTDWNFTPSSEPFDSDTWSELPANQPFYAQVNFPETHRGSEWNDAHQKIATPADPQAVEIPPYYPDHPVTREDWAQYLNTVMALDLKIGVVLDLLERDGLADNTVVIFMGDHGRAMVRGKQWPYDSGLHVPLMVYWPESMQPPEGYAAGQVDEQLIAAIDITATTLAVAGISKPEGMQGRVFLGPQAEPPRRYVFGGRDRGDETVDRIRTVRSDRYRYIRNFMPERPFLQTNRYKEASYPVIWVLRSLHAQGALTPAQAYLMAPSRPAEELYDLETDPYEVTNLADSAEHQDVLGELRAELDRWLEESGDLGSNAEDPAVLEHYEQRMMEIYDERIEALRQEWGLAGGAQQPPTSSVGSSRR